MNEPKLLPMVIGGNARRMRIEAGATLDQMAIAVGRFGTTWSTGRVGDLESGRVSPTLPTLITVAFALGSLSSRSISLADLVQSDDQVQIGGLSLSGEHLVDAVRGHELGPSMLSGGLSLGGQIENAQADIESLAQLEGQLGPLDWELASRVERTQGLAEQRIAKDLGIAVGTLAYMAAHLWKRTFSEERDARAGSDANAQKRGRVSRQMKSELQSALKGMTNGDD